MSYSEKKSAGKAINRVSCHNCGHSLPQASTASTVPQSPHHCFSHSTLSKLSLTCVTRVKSHEYHTCQPSRVSPVPPVLVSPVPVSPVPASRQQCHQCHRVISVTGIWCHWSLRCHSATNVSNVTRATSVAGVTMPPCTYQCYLNHQCHHNLSSMSPVSPVLVQQC